MTAHNQPFGRIILLGGSSEIGLAIVDQTSAPHAAICLVGRSSTRQTAAAHLLRSKGHTVTEATYNTAMTLNETHDVLLNAQNLIGGTTSPVDAVIMAIGTMGEPQTPETTLTTNLVGPALLIRSSQRLLASQGSGTLIVLSSAAALRPREAILDYAIAKQGIDTLVRTTTASMAAQGVSTLLVRPGFVSTPMTAHLTPPPLASTPQATGHQVAQALQSGKSVVWVPKKMRWAILLLRILPRPVLPPALR